MKQSSDFTRRFRGRATRIDREGALSRSTDTPISKDLKRTHVYKYESPFVTSGGSIVSGSNTPHSVSTRASM